MIIPLEPRLEGLAERRFFSFARQMLDRQARDPARIGNLVEDETTRVSGLDDLKGQSDQYEACVSVLGDRAQLRGTLVESGYGLELHSPRLQDKRVSGPVQARRRKDAIRNELRPRVLQQLADPNVRKFIHRMERPPASARRKSIRTLIADGAELRGRLGPYEGLAEVVTAATPGGGTLPGVEIESVGVSVPGDHTGALRSRSRPIIARVSDGATVADLRTVHPDDDAEVAAALREVAG